jgi:polygalacturonase
VRNFVFSSGLRRRIVRAIATFAVLGSLRAEFSVRDYGAKGDGVTLDTASINRAIEAASAVGGGSVVFPAGTYASFTVRLRSNITLRLEAGATLLAAEPVPGGDGYDSPEPNPRGGPYVDFGHGHLHNSLLWGENLENVSILGPGRIFGRGLSKGKDTRVRDPLPDEKAEVKSRIARMDPPPEGDAASRGESKRNPKEVLAAGIGNKAIALWHCRNVLLRDFTLFHGGHFAINVKGIDGLTIDNLKIDTNRDGIDIDTSRNVRVLNCAVNSPYDDAIVLKSSYATGSTRATENVTIANCQVSGYDEGTLLDGTLGRAMMTRSNAPRFGPCGRIKLGTESTGGFRNIAIANCTFDCSRGLALEMVDGGVLEDVTISNLVMRDVTNAPIFVRLGGRGRGPTGDASKPAPVSVVRRVRITGVTADSANGPDGILIDGLEEQAIQDLTLTDLVITMKGGGTAEDAARIVPELPREYPEPGRWGVLPAWGAWIRHVRNLQLSNVSLRALNADARPAVFLGDVHGASLEKIRVGSSDRAQILTMKNSSEIETYRSPGLPDGRVPEAK